eukprot:TRINITY_DN4289_c0_g1_i1.p1 TRINITY_DN4289_c0_g1~~TRINITY_DN4289_c0_g1_i1.p1  ORF type:complete len:298 (-),score=90.72 TRINITY_DN4289_c0_g1_i1:200-1093(-)
MGIETRELTTETHVEMTVWDKVIASGVGSIISAIVVNPFDVVKARMQAQHKSNALQFNGTIDAFSKIVKYEGTTTLWRGLPPTLLMSVPAGAMYFTAYEYLKRIIKKNTELGYMATPMLAGFGARTVTAAITSPLELIRTNLQATSPNSLKNEGVYNLTKRLISKQGWRGLWGGLPPTLLRDAPFSAFYWSTFEYFRRIFHSKIESQFLIDFISGAIGGMVAAGMTNPIDVIKTRRQMRLGSETGVSGSSMEITRKIWKEEGYSGFFRGFLPRVAKVAPACAIMISCYEGTKAFLNE